MYYGGSKMGRMRAVDPGDAVNVGSQKLAASFRQAFILKFTHNALYLFFHEKFLCDTGVFCGNSLIANEPVQRNDE
jgi:hypothetical protein